MQSLITRNDLLWAITIASLYCSVLKVHFGYLLHPLANGTGQSCLFLCLEVRTSFLIMLKLIKLATPCSKTVMINSNLISYEIKNVLLLRAGLKSRGPGAIFTGGPRQFSLEGSYDEYHDVNVCKISFRRFATFSFAFSDSRLCACRIHSIARRL